MPEVRIHRGADLDWALMSQLYPPEMQSEMSEADLNSSMTTHEAGADGSLHLEELRFLPGSEARLHAHDMAEIIYVLEGTLRIGNQELEPGSSVYIGADTLYSFKAGERGARLLIFMASGQARYWSKDEFMARAKQRPAQQAQG